MSEITAHNQACSPLLRLPAELRNRVYAYTMTMPESVWDQSDPNVYFSSRFNYYMKRPDDLAETKRDEQRDIQRKHLSIILACQQTYKECRLLPFTLHTIFFDSGSCMSLWIGKLHERQRHAIRSLHLEYTWTQKRGLRHGTVIPATQTWLRELNELRRVEVTVKIAFPMIRAEVGEEKLKRQLDAVAGTFKKAMEVERPGLEYVVRALYVERGSS